MEAILANFGDIGVELNPDWLAGLELCNDGPLSEDDVYMALMTSDIRETCTGSQSNRLLNVSHLAAGSFLFQITSAVDISIPDCQRPKESCATASTTGRRMLKFKLHSGNNTEIDAVEMEPIRGLSDSPDAGMKIIIHGSPPVYRGLVMLSQQNVRIVGGEVGHLSFAQKRDNVERLRMRDPLAGGPASRGIQTRT